MCQNLIVKCIHNAMYLAYFFLVNQVLLVDCLTTGSKLTEFNLVACHGDTLTFECTVNGGATTVWKGSAFKCMPTTNDIVLLHSRPNAIGTCDDGELKAYADLEVFGDKYFSRINITTTYPFTVSMFTVACILDNGTTETIVSNWTVSINNGVHSCGGSINTTSLDDPKQNISGIFCRHAMALCNDTGYIHTFMQYQT